MDTKRKKIRGDWKSKIALREEEVMDILGFSKSTIARLRRNGELPYSKVGGSYFYLPKELKRLLKDRLIKPS
ncbi:helix-turn-helix domain-containing protein [Bizionia paragorgiae]|uniref:helix-turn-helix domain-containing protein n=1 Tax=Bizionia paragorgiae TaxID=283786 RepID=UPI003A8F640E